MIPERISGYDTPFCIKCNGDKISLKYCTEIAWFSEAVARYYLTSYHYPVPHMHLTCERCGHKWKMLPLDALAYNEKTWKEAWIAARDRCDSLNGSTSTGLEPKNLGYTLSELINGS